jgi:hypothetical protein
VGQQFPVLEESDVFYCEEFHPSFSWHIAIFTRAHSEEGGAGNQLEDGDLPLRSGGGLTLSVLYVASLLGVCCGSPCIVLIE